MSVGRDKANQSWQGDPLALQRMELEQPLHLSGAPYFLLYLALKVSQPDRACFLTIFSDNLLLFPFFSSPTEVYVEPRSVSESEKWGF